MLANCIDSTIVTAYSVSPNDFDFDIGYDSSVIVTFNPWSYQGYPNCGNFTYTLACENSTSFDMAIFTLSGQTISIVSGLNTNGNSYNISLTGNLATTTSSINVKTYFTINFKQFTITFSNTPAP